MESLNNLIVGYLGPFGPLMLVGMLGLFMILAMLPFVFKKRDDPLDRINSTEKQASTEKVEALRASKGTDKLDRFAEFLEPQNKDEFSAVQLKLVQAGYRSQNAVRIYYFLQLTLGVIGLICGAIFTFLEMQKGAVATQDLIVMLFGPGFGGYYGPKYWVTRKQQERQEAIINGFPDALDMMLVCVEAGQSLDQSIIRVAGELRAGFPELSSEFDIVSQQLKAGRDKTNVLRDMAERAGAQDITSFVTVLVQSQQFGTPIADALRVFSAEMRDKRIMRAEEAANKLPTKMTLATMMLTVPPLLIILIGPAVYDIATNFG